MINRSFDSLQDAVGNGTICGVSTPPAACGFASPLIIILLKEIPETTGSMLARRPKTENSMLARRPNTENPSLARRPRLENLARISFSIFKFAENLSSWGPPHDPAQPAQPAYAAN